MVILLVDDDKEILDVTKLMLENYEVYTATTGQQAIAVAKELKPDLVLLDVNIPDPNGYDVCKEIKEQSENIVKVIFVSGNGEVENRLRGYNCGADDYVVKPYEHEELLAKIEVYNRIIDIEKSLKAKNDQFKSLALKMTQQVSERESENLNLKKLTTVGQYTAEIAQSLQNSMIAIRGYSSVLFQKHKDDYLFSKIIHSVDSAEELLRTTLLFKFENQKSNFNLNQIVTDEIRFLNLNPYFKNNTKVYLPLKKIPEISGIRANVSQAFHTLLNLVFETSRKLFKPVITIQSSFSTNKNMIVIHIKQADSSGPFHRETRPEENKEFDYIKTVIEADSGTFTVNSRENENYSFTIEFPATSVENSKWETTDKAV
jgi:CheY-like chemotaxis protein